MSEAWVVGSAVLRDWLVRGVGGEGGFGTVYKIEHRLTGAFAAAKRAHLPGAESRRAVLAEIEGWLGLPEHPHLVRCRFARTVQESEVVVVSDWVDGGSLADRMKASRMPVSSIIDASVQAAWGLHAAHSAGLVHQDIKPHNILLSADGRALVCDFGRGMTVPFCSPEQSRGEALTPATDQFSWALTVLAMLLGECVWGFGPEAADNLADLADTVPREVRSVVERCLDPSPGARFADMHQAAAALSGADSARQAPPIVQATFASVPAWRDPEEVHRELVALAPMAVPKTLPVSAPTRPRTPMETVPAGALASSVAMVTVPAMSILSPISSTPRSRMATPSQAASDLPHLESALEAAIGALDRAPAGLDAFVARLQCDVGESLLLLGDIEPARDRFLDALRVLESHPLRAKHPYRDAHARGLSAIGRIRARTGELAPARMLLQQALALLPGDDEIPSRVSRARLLNDIGDNHYAALEYDPALMSHGRARREVEHVPGDPAARRELCRAFGGLSRVFGAQLAWTDALELSDQALKALGSGENPPLEERELRGRLLLVRARAYEGQKDLDHALASTEECLQDCANAAFLSSVAIEALVFRATLSHRRGKDAAADRKGALAALREAIARTGQEEQITEYVDVCLAFASQLRTNDPAEASRLANEAVRVLTYLCGDACDRPSRKATALFQSRYLAYALERRRSSRQERLARIEWLEQRASQWASVEATHWEVLATDLRITRVLTLMGLR